MKASEGIGQAAIFVLNTPLLVISACIIVIIINRMGFVCAQQKVALYLSLGDTQTPFQRIIKLNKL